MPSNCDTRSSKSSKLSLLPLLKEDFDRNASQLLLLPFIGLFELA